MHHLLRLATLASFLTGAWLVAKAATRVVDAYERLAAAAQDQPWAEVLAAQMTGLLCADAYHYEPDDGEAMDPLAMPERHLRSVS